MKIGQAIDIHPLKQGRDLIIGGVKIDHYLGLDGHSDADVLVHAIAEAILGALNLGDLGKHFPDTDPKYKGISSLLLLKEVYKLMDDKGYKIGNIDSTVVIEKPKLAPYKEQMAKNIAQVLNTSVENVSVKATRGEKLGFVGNQEGAVSLAVVLLEEKEEKNG